MQFAIFLIGYTLSQFYRSFLAVIAPELSHELHLSGTDLGRILACWFATFALAQFWIGAALDKHGPRRTLPIIMLPGIAGALVSSRAAGAGDAMLAMSLIGVGCSAALMGPLYVFARTYAPDRFAMMSALVLGLGSFGNLLGGTPLALATQAFGWRSVFVGLAVITAIAAALIAMFVRDPPRAQATEHDNGGIISGLKAILAIRQLWPVWPIMSLAYGILITERGLWVGPYLSQVHGLEPVARGNVILVMAIAIAAGALAYGPLERWLRRRKVLALWGSVIAGAALLFLAWVAKPPIQVAALALAVFGFTAMTYGTLMAHIRNFLPDHLLGRGMTFANFLCMAGAGLLQIWSGWYVDMLKTASLSDADLFAHLHGALGAAMLVSAAVYAFARETDTGALAPANKA